MKHQSVLVSLLLSVSGFGIAWNTSAKPLQLRIYRWLEVHHLIGRVTYYRGDSSHPAQVGTRLQNVGDAIATGAGSSAALGLDTNLGTVNLASNTMVRVKQLEAVADGGRLTRLQVTGGQVRFQVRSLNHPNSSLEIQTPAGSSAVRGTEFGMNVDPSGRTALATLEGKVVLTGQGKSVVLEAGMQSLLLPGQAPSPPEILTNDTRLDVRSLKAVQDGQTDSARLMGQVASVNLLTVAGRLQRVDGRGQFDITVPLPTNRRLEAVVRTPLGVQQIYELSVP